MPNGFFLGPVYIRFYGMIIMLGALAGAFLATWEARRRGEAAEKVWDMLVWLIVGGVVGARLWHIFTPSAADAARGLTTQYYLTHPLDAMATWHGGLGIPGGVLGGLLALYLFTRRNEISFLTWTDIIAPGLALGQAIGRWGNFFNQELYGQPSNLPWAITIEPAYRLAGYENIARYHPLFLYESLWNLLNVFFMLWLGRRFVKWLKPGDIFLTYLITYPFARFTLEFLRLDIVRLGELNVNQTVMLVVFISATIALIGRHIWGSGGVTAQPVNLEEDPTEKDL